MFKQSLLISCVIALAIADPFPVPADATLTTTAYQKDQFTFHAATFFFGNTGTVTQALEFNLNQNDTLVISKAAADKWGLDCTEAINCSLPDSDLLPGTYYGQDYKYRPATVPIRPNADAITPDDKYVRHGIQFVQEKPLAWTDSQWGAIGFGPQSKFSSYVRGAYAADFSIMFKYTKEDKEVAAVQYTVEATVGAKHDGLTAIDTIAVPADAVSWDFTSNVYLANSPPTFLATPSTTCLTNVGNEVAYHADAATICDNAFKAVCDGKTGADCKKGTADFSKGTNLVFKIGDKTYELTPAQYLRYTDTGALVCRLQVPTPIAPYVNCDAKATTFLSKGFIDVYPVVLTYIKAGGSNIQFLGTGANPDDQPSSKLWIILLAIAAVIAVGVLVYIFFFRKQNHNDAEVNYVSV